MRNLVENTALISFILWISNQVLRDAWAYWSEAIESYFIRPYDLDRNPDTRDYCLIFHPESGKKEIVGLTCKLTLNRHKNGVRIHYFTDDWQPKAIERVAFGKWRRNFRHSKLTTMPDFNRSKSSQE